MENKPCLQYITDLTEEKIMPCINRDIENFNNLNFDINNLYENVREYYNPRYHFKENYKDETIESLCNPSTFSLKNQQKFLGQFVNPNTNVKGILIYHGLGSGKTCTSIVIGEAFKSTTTGGNKINNPNKKFNVIVCPASLVGQYRSEIIGKIQKGKSNNWGCTSQCIYLIPEIDNESEKYIDEDLMGVLDTLKEQYINKERETPTNEKESRKIQNDLKQIEKTLNVIHDQIKESITQSYYIISHDKFRNCLNNNFSQHSH